MKKLFVLLAVLGLTACGTPSKLVGTLPTVDDPANASKILVVRSGDPFAIAEGYPIEIDGERIFGIDTSEYGEVSINPGKHKITSSCYNQWIPIINHAELEVETKPGKTTYIEFRSDGAPLRCMLIIELEEQEAQPLIEKAKKIDLTPPAN